MNDRGLGSTYRIQVQGLGFDQTRLLVPYLAELGIQTLYLSPVFAATPGSSHGYDVVDPQRLDPSLGSPRDFERLLDELRSYEMGALLDIVPNHMAAVPENAWWWDVLRRGKESDYASTFDIRWSEQQGRVLVPVLPRPLADVIMADALVVDEESNELDVDGIRLPLGVGPVDNDRTALLLRQHYRPAYWRTSATQGNYRRFFDINSLIGVRVEDPTVFERTHGLIAELTRHPAIVGVRVDHIDGLTDPARYLDRLRDLVPQDKSIVVEKILGQRETIPAQWPIDGTTGYEFADRVMALFVDPAGAARLRSAGEAFCGLGESSLTILTRQGKREMLERSFPAELDHLARLSREALDAESPGHDLSEHHIRRAWTELIVALPVYRTYVDDDGASRSDRTYLEAASAAPLADLESRRALETLSRAVSERARAGSPWLAVAHRWQQLSGAAMAKGSEDTAMYRYPGLLARADVGGEPDADDGGLDRFHCFIAERVGGLNATSTHDSKRSEDARHRLAVLSEQDAEWMSLVSRWSAAHAEGDLSPHPVEQLAIFQAFLCLWPNTTDRFDDETIGRVIRQAVKGARESKLRSSWTEPDEQYEDELARFVRAVHGDPSFREELAGFTRSIGPAALVNSISSVVLKVCAPGVPDFYQGSELVEPTLTDPDNRRSVDFATRSHILGELPEPSMNSAKELLSHWTDGRIKIYVTRTLLRDRRRSAPLYARGKYEPLPSTARQIVAFRRSLEGEGSLICLVPRLTYDLAGPGAFPTGERVWGEATLTIPAAPTAGYRDLLTGREFQLDAETTPLSHLLDVLPVAVLRQTDG